MLHVLLSGRLPFLGSGQRLHDLIGHGRVVVSIQRRYAVKIGINKKHLSTARIS